MTRLRNLLCSILGAFVLPALAQPLVGVTPPRMRLVSSEGSSGFVKVRIHKIHQTLKAKQMWRCGGSGETSTVGGGGVGNGELEKELQSHMYTDNVPPNVRVKECMQSDLGLSISPTVAQAAPH